MPRAATRPASRLYVTRSTAGRQLIPAVGRNFGTANTQNRKHFLRCGASLLDARQVVTLLEMLGIQRLRSVYQAFLGG